MSKQMGHANPSITANVYAQQIADESGFVNGGGFREGAVHEVFPMGSGR